MVGNTNHTQYMLAGKAVVDLYMVTGMGHAIAIGADPAGMCPSTSGAFFSDQKICSTLRAAQFFGLLGGNDPGGGGSGSGSGSDGGDDSGDGAPGGGCNAGNHGVAALAAIALIALWRRRRYAR
jgi:uncharacterized protein (TIGR03382 family)